MKDKKLVKSSQHGFTKGTLHLANMIAFYNEITASAAVGRTVNVVYLGFKKIF